MQSLTLTFNVWYAPKKRCNFQIQIYDSEVTMQSFTVCTKLMIKIQKTKMPSNAKCLFFLYFQYNKNENAGTEK